MISNKQAKTSISLLIDSKLVKELDNLNGKRSHNVEKILKSYFFEEDEIKKQLENLKKEEKSLKNKLKKIKADKKDETKNLTAQEKNRLIEDSLNQNEIGISRIRFNRDFSKNLSEKQYKELLKQWEN